MPGNFRAAFMRRSHGSGKLRRSDEHVRLKAVHALVQPEIHGLRGIVWPAELVHLQRPTARPFQIRSGHVHLRPGRFAFINLLLELKVSVRFERTCGADRSHSPGQVQTRKAVRHLTENAVAHGVEHVIVHAHEAGDYAVTMQVQHLRVFRDTRRCRIGNGFYLSLAEKNCLIFARSRARAINHAHVR